MSTLKTLPNDASVNEFIDTVSDETKKADSLVLLELYSKITGEKKRVGVMRP